MSNFKAPGSIIYQSIYLISFCLIWLTPLFHPVLNFELNLIYLKTSLSTSSALILLPLLLHIINKLRSAKSTAEIVFVLPFLLLSGICFAILVSYNKYFISSQNLNYLLLIFCLQIIIFLNLLKNNLLLEAGYLLLNFIITTLSFGLLNYPINLLGILYNISISGAVYSMQAGIRLKDSNCLSTKKMIAINNFLPLLIITQLCLQRLLPANLLLLFLLLPSAMLIADLLELKNYKPVKLRYFLALNSGHNLLFLSIILYTAINF